MKVAIVGTREYKNVGQIIKFVKALGKKHPDTIIVSGGARGPDSIAVETAKEIGLPSPIVFPAKWKDENGVMDWGAGMKRNTDIVNESDIVVAFYDGKSNGTRDTINKAVKANKKVHIYLDSSANMISL